MLSIIIPWHNRNELQLSLPSIIKNMRDVGGEIMIVNLGGDFEQLKHQVGNWQDSVSIINVTTEKAFNKPVAQNFGAKHTRCPYLFFCDCDIILPDGILASLLEKLQEAKDLFATLKGVRETEKNARKANNLTFFGYSLRLKVADGTEVNIVDNEEDTEFGTRQAPGLLMLRRESFEKVNGYDSHLDGWGWEDQDMICRLTLSAKLKRINWGTASHISHGDQERMQGYHYADRWQSRDKMFRRALAKYDQGLFQGSYKEDIDNYEVEVIS